MGKQMQFALEMGLEGMKDILKGINCLEDTDAKETMNFYEDWR